MRISIHLLYHGNPIDTRHANVYNRGHQHTTVPIDIGMLIDSRTKDAVRKVIGEPTTPTDLDRQSALTYHTYGGDQQPFQQGALDVPNENNDQQRRRRRNRRLLNRIGDPENGFPILRELIQTFAPILIQYLMKNLPIWLTDLEHEEENATPVV